MPRLADWHSKCIGAASVMGLQAPNHRAAELPLRRLIALCGALMVSVTVESAEAYSTNSPLSDPCHEEITQGALARARAQLGAVDRVSAGNDDERALIKDLPFGLRSDQQDLGAATLVLGNRDLDFDGNEPDDLDQLAPLHGSPDRQDEHCLRTAAQDGLEGSVQALEQCKSFIRRKIEAALDGMDAAGTVDPAVRTRFDAVLDIRGSVEVPLPTYHVEMGRALHTIQDGFSHAYRTEDHLEVVTVLNYIEMVEDTLSAVDGPAHLTPLDACRGLDSLRKGRLEIATQASADFLIATLDSSRSRTQKLSAVDQLLDRYFSHAAACDAENGWCEAPEAEYENPTRGCTVAGAGPIGWNRFAGLPWSGLALLALLRMRRPGSRVPRGQHRPRPWLVMLAIVLFSLLGTQAAWSQVAEETGDNTAEPDPVAQPVTSAVVAREDARIDAPPGTAWGGAINLSGSLQKAAVAAALGARYRLDKHWLVGLDLEYNPWYARSSSEWRQGVVSAYGTLIVRFPMRFERTNLRSTLQLGASRMSFDLYGVPEGTIGPFVGFNLLGLDYELGRQIFLIVNPAHIALPIPQTSGAPFSFPQYRVTLGLQFGA